MIVNRNRMNHNDDACNWKNDSSCRDCESMVLGYNSGSRIESRTVEKILFIGGT